MQGQRYERVAELIREELGMLLVRRVKDPALSGVTITGVRVSPDLSTATAFFAAEDAEAERIQIGLTRAASFMRREIGAKLRLKRTPQLRFERDQAIEHGAKIDSILRDIAQDDSGEER